MILQQEAFASIDATGPLGRQKYMYEKVLGSCARIFEFSDFEECSQFFKWLINMFRQLNYSPFESEQYFAYYKQIDEAVEQKVAK